ncbi:hypothetical protein [Levilactobacillus wangkuiensis]|nr:hypothetical protein [Levilactobacillus wangkuiensis]
MSKQRKHTKKSTLRKKKRRMAEHIREHKERENAEPVEVRHERR